MDRVRHQHTARTGAAVTVLALAAALTGCTAGGGGGVARMPATGTLATGVPAAGTSATGSPRPPVMAARARTAIAVPPGRSATELVPTAAPSAVTRTPDAADHGTPSPRSAPTTVAGGARQTVTSPAVASAGAPAFRSSISRIDSALARRMRSSYHQGCPVPLADLRYLRLSYWGFDGSPHTGELVVSARVAPDVVTAFRSLFADRFPIRQMRLVDDFGGSDGDSMAADNTSAFNCRPVTGGGGWSEHSYGEAIDINPVQNPYLAGSAVLPPAGAAFRNRPDGPGVIHAGGVVVRAFAAIGWTWGGTWTSPVDLQHFSRSGR